MLSHTASSVSDYVSSVHCLSKPWKQFNIRGKLNRSSTMHICLWYKVQSWEVRYCANTRHLILERQNGQEVTFLISLQGNYERKNPDEHITDPTDIRTEELLLVFLLFFAGLLGCCTFVVYLLKGKSLHYHMKKENLPHVL